MKTMRVDDDIRRAILKNVEVIVKELSAMVRVMVELKEKTPSPNIDVNRDILNFLKSTKFQNQPFAVNRFLSILSYLYTRHPFEFSKVPTIKGTTRKYFAERKDELEACGNSVFPKQIPNSNYWVVTNNDTNKNSTLAKL